MMQHSRFPRSALPFSNVLSELDERIERFAPLCVGPRLTSLTLAAPKEMDARQPFHLDDLWRWGRVEEGALLVGIGCAFQQEFDSRAELAGAAKELVWNRLDPENVGIEPVAFAGFAFQDQKADLPTALLRIPEMTARWTKDGAALIFSHNGILDEQTLIRAWKKIALRFVKAAQQSIPVQKGKVERRENKDADDRYLERVKKVRDAVRSGKIEKAVVSRIIEIQGERPFDPAALMASLSERYPNCAVLCASFGGKYVVAASPERLAARRGERISSLALAGTAANDPTPFLDRSLLSSYKDRIEHQPVIQHIASVLGGICEGRIIQPPEPIVVALGSLQHLATPISGRLRPGQGLLDAALGLHPTPAIAGWPTDDALALIDALGEVRIGWYAGAMGWFEPGGDGELDVILRCCVLDGDKALLSAGGGIVAQSWPETELAETELKFSAILDSLKAAMI